MAKYAGATWRPVANHSQGGMLENRGLILHVQAGNHSPFGWFNNPASSASAHFWIGKLGQVEQYVDTTDKAWAQKSGNPYWISVETEGFPDEALNSAQINAMAELYAWGVRVFKWPLVLANTPSAKGLGWHGMGPDWGHQHCPGDLRRAQRAEILARAAAIINPPKAAPAPAYPGHVIEEGSADHANVKRVQVQLQKTGAKISADGVFGPRTGAAVRTFQTHHGLAADGQVGKATWPVLFKE